MKQELKTTTSISSSGTRRGHLSPLRYPGGKAALADFLADTIEFNGLAGCSYFEPFAGGAGAALRLLMGGVVSEVHLNDLDPRIFAFWKAALCEPDRFVDAIMAIPLTVAEWYRQREICRLASASQPFELGFATFFLNRCNRSGVISGAAPIGGYSQSGNWKIDARFNRIGLSKRIRDLAKHGDRIHVTGMDACEFLRARLPRSRQLRECFVYLDPPYYAKGSRLYFDACGDEDHRRIADFVTKHEALRWIVSYDDSEFIRELYQSCRISDLSVRYSLQIKRQANELLIRPPYVRLPPPTAHMLKPAVADSRSGR